MAPTRIGAFELHALLGSGGMGDVWAGLHDGPAATQVAVKVLREDDPDRRESFRTEARAVASLSHPNVVPILDYGELDEAAAADLGAPMGSPYLVMALAEGGTLAGRKGTAPWPEVRELLLDLLDALAHAHARGVVHRDVKPANVLVHRERPWLSDFGIAHLAVRRDADGRASRGGTPPFMAPEQFDPERGQEGPWTDLYALGCVAWALLAGRAPFRGSGYTEFARKHLFERPPSLPQDLGAPAALDAWLARLLAKEPRDRYRRAADAAWDLAAIRGGVRRVAPARNGEPEPRTTLVWVAPPAGARRARRSDRRSIRPPPLPTDWRRPRPTVRLPIGLGLYGLRAVPLVDRDTERETLWAGLRQVIEQRRPRVELLIGPSGTGKTRLAEWLCERAHEVGAAHVLQVWHGDPAGPRDGIGPMLARFLCPDGVATPARLRAAVAALGVDEPHRREAIVRAASGPVPRRTRLAAAVALIAALARERAVILSIDDLQWGPSSAALVREVIGPVLVVLTAQEDVGPPVEDVLPPGVERLPVGPLPPEHGAALVRELLGLRGDLARRVEERAEGNPLFAVQLVGSLVERGDLLPDGDAFRLRPGAVVELPQDLRNVWDARAAEAVDGWSPAEVESLSIAAALGPSVDAPEWAAACRAAGVTPAFVRVDGLVRKRLARAWPGGLGAGFSFAHAMLREAVLARDADLRAHHLACARALAEASTGPGRARFGRHLLQAGRTTEAVEPLARAVTLHLDTSDTADAGALLGDLERALEDARIGPRDERWGDLFTLQGRLSQMEHDGQARRWYEATIAAGERHGWVATRCYALAQLASIEAQVGRAERADSLLAEAERLAREARDDKSLGHVAINRAFVLKGRGRLAEAETAGAVALAAFVEADDRNSVGSACEQLSEITKQLGRLDDALGWSERAAEYYRDVGNREGVAICLNMGGEVARLRGDLPRAEALYREAAARAEAVGDPNAAFPRANLGLVMLALGRADEATTVLESVFRTFERWDAVGMTAAIAVALLACAAARRDERAWSRWLARAELDLGRSGFVDRDVACTAEDAARRAEIAGWPRRADQARRIARDQWSLLEGPEGS